MTEAEALFERMLISRGEAYLVAEGALRESEESAAVLTRQLNHADPIGRLTARVMLEWADAATGEFDAAAAYLDALDRRFGPTVAGMPPVTGVVENLSARFGPRIAEFLALRLVQQPQPAWRVLATLGYLDRHKNPATTEALVRFAARAGEPRLQDLTARVVAGIGDPDLARKLATERDRLAAQGAQLPRALASLAGAAGTVA